MVQVTVSQVKFAKHIKKVFFQEIKYRYVEKLIPDIGISIIIGQLSHFFDSQFHRKNTE